MKKRRFQILLIMGICLVTYSMLMGDTAWAADATNQAETIINGGTGINSTFDEQFKTIAKAFWTIANVIMIVMTSVAGVMVGFGIEDGKKTFWNWTLGIGLLWGFGNFLDASGLLQYGEPAQTQAPQWYQPDFKDNAKDLDFLSGFMQSYLDGVITPGAKNIQGYCVKILLILAIIEVSWEMAFKLISGDKIKYILTVTIKLGFFVWLITNWIPLMQALGDGFQAIGFAAGGLTTAEGDNLKPDSIFNNALTIFYTFWKVASFKSIGLFFVNLISLFIIMLAAILTAIEMFMARIEFYTMALITMPLLPFMITSKFSFLGEKAIGAMFNLAIKVCVIAFITAFAVPFMQTFADKVAHTSDAWKQIGLIFQCVLAALVIYFLTKKVPELVTGLLSGQPSIGGASMVDTATKAASGAMAVAGNVRAAHAIAKGAGKNGLTGTASNLVKSAALSRAPFQAYRKAYSNMDSYVGAGRQSATNMRTNMRLGKDAAGRSGTDEATKNNLKNIGADVAKKGSALSSREQRQYEQLTKKFNEMMDRKYPKGKK